MHSEGSDLLSVISSLCRILSAFNPAQWTLRVPMSVSCCVLTCHQCLCDALSCYCTANLPTCINTVNWTELNWSVTSKQNVRVLVICAVVWNHRKLRNATLNTAGGWRLHLWKFVHYKVNSDSVCVLLCVCVVVCVLQVSAPRLDVTLSDLQDLATRQQQQIDAQQQLLASKVQHAQHTAANAATANNTITVTPLQTHTTHQIHLPLLSQTLLLFPPQTVKVLCGRCCCFECDTMTCWYRRITWLTEWLMVRSVQMQREYKFTLLTRHSTWGGPVPRSQLRVDWMNLSHHVSMNPEQRSFSVIRLSKQIRSWNNNIVM